MYDLGNLNFNAITRSLKFYFSTCLEFTIKTEKDREEEEFKTKVIILSSISFWKLKLDLEYFLDILKCIFLDFRMRIRYTFT